MGIYTQHTGLSLYAPDSLIWLTEGLDQPKESEIIASPRVGVAYAKECAAWPWRFRLAGSKWTSPAK